MKCGEILRITKPEEVVSVTDIIHDCKFDKDRIIFDPANSTLVIEFSHELRDKKTVLKRILFLKKLRIPIVKYILKISDVESYQIYEDSQVGPGTEDFFNKITYDSQQKQIKILTIITKAIEVKVNKFNISIENTCQIIGEKIVVSF